MKLLEKERLFAIGLLKAEGRCRLAAIAARELWSTPDCVGSTNYDDAVDASNRELLGISE